MKALSTYFLLMLVLLVGCNDRFPEDLKISAISYKDSLFTLNGEKLNLIKNLSFKLGNKIFPLTQLRTTTSQIEAKLSGPMALKTDESASLVVKASDGALKEIPLTISLAANSVGLAELKLQEIEEHFDSRYQSNTGGSVKNCPAGYLKIPGSSVYGTSDFCMMKYEASSGLSGAQSKAGATPLEPVSITLAQTLCSAQGSGFTIPTNAQWMTVATNIAAQSENWSGGSVGNGKINMGHSDNVPSNTLAASSDDNNACYMTGENCDQSTWHEQRRTHRLSSGEYIWDIAGNAWEYVSWYVYKGRIGESTSWRKLSSFTTADETDQMKLIELRPTQATSGFWDDHWDETQGFGRYLPQKNTVGGVAVRGGSYQMGPYTGIMALMLKFTQIDAAVSVGFRCVYNL